MLADGVGRRGKKRRGEEKGQNIKGKEHLRRYDRDEEGSVKLTLRNFQIYYLDGLGLRSFLLSGRGRGEGGGGAPHPFRRSSLIIQGRGVSQPVEESVATVWVHEAVEVGRDCL